MTFLEPYAGPFRNGPQKTPKNGYFWVFLPKIWYLNRGQVFNFIVGDTSRCKRVVKQESWWWGYCGVPKKAQKGPLKRKKCSFFFIVTTKIEGMTSNLKWKFLINATTIMYKFVALLRWLHRKIWPQKPKIAPKKSVFWINWPKKQYFKVRVPQFFFPFC